MHILLSALQKTRFYAEHVWKAEVIFQKVIMCMIYQYKIFKRPCTTSGNQIITCLININNKIRL